MGDEGWTCHRRQLPLIRGGWVMGKFPWGPAAWLVLGLGITSGVAYGSPDDTAGGTLPTAPSRAAQPVKAAGIPFRVRNATKHNLALPLPPGKVTVVPP